MKPSANVRALTRLLLAAEEDAGVLPMGMAGVYEEMASFLARRGVLAVSAKTVPDSSDGFVRLMKPQLRWELRTWLRRLARGAAREEKDHE
jgi:hypothetical protein